jgi:hypothetical protein
VELSEPVVDGGDMKEIIINEMVVLTRFGLKNILIRPSIGILFPVAYAFRLANGLGIYKLDRLIGKLRLLFGLVMH